MGWNNDGSFTLDDETFRPDFSLSPAEMKKHDREMIKRLTKKLRAEQEAIARRVLGPKKTEK